MSKVRERQTTVTLRIQSEDRKLLRGIAARLGLKESEIGRRALRLGLDVLKKAQLPGSVIEMR